MKKRWRFGRISFITFVAIFFTISTVNAESLEKPKPSNTKKPVKVENKGDFIIEYFNGPTSFNIPSEKQIAKKKGIKNIPTTYQILSTYDNTDPAATGCSNDAITARSANIRSTDNTLLGTVELRYSPSCKTAWARLTVSNLSYLKHGSTSLYRKENNVFNLKAFAYVTPGDTNYTNQFNDDQTVSYGSGTIINRSGQSFNAQTQPY
jgi:hypothetical protein